MHTLTYISFIQTTSMLKYYHICSLSSPLRSFPTPLLNICLCPRNLEHYFSKFFEKWIEAAFFWKVLVLLVGRPLFTLNTLNTFLNRILLGSLSGGLWPINWKRGLICDYKCSMETFACSFHQRSKLVQGRQNLTPIYPWFSRGSLESNTD